jgi:hypothetical protein
MLSLTRIMFVLILRRRPSSTYRPKAAKIRSDYLRDTGSTTRERISLVRFGHITSCPPITPIGGFISQDSFGSSSSLLQVPAPRVIAGRVGIQIPVRPVPG